VPRSLPAHTTDQLLLALRSSHRNFFARTFPVALSRSQRRARGASSTSHPSPPRRVRPGRPGVYLFRDPQRRGALYPARARRPARRGCARTYFAPIGAANSVYVLRRLCRSHRMARARVSVRCGTRIAAAESAISGRLRMPLARPPVRVAATSRRQCRSASAQELKVRPDSFAAARAARGAPLHAEEVDATVRASRCLLGWSASLADSCVTSADPPLRNARGCRPVCRLERCLPQLEARSGCARSNLHRRARSDPGMRVPSSSRGRSPARRTLPPAAGAHSRIRGRLAASRRALYGDPPATTSTSSSWSHFSLRSRPLSWADRCSERDRDPCRPLDWRLSGSRLDRPGVEDVSRSRAGSRPVLISSAQWARDVCPLQGGRKCVASSLQRFGCHVRAAGWTRYTPTSGFRRARQESPRTTGSSHNPRSTTVRICTAEMS